MSPKEYGIIMSRFDLLPWMTPEKFGKIAALLFDFMDKTKSYEIDEVLARIPNLEN